MDKKELKKLAAEAHDYLQNMHTDEDEKYVLEIFTGALRSKQQDIIDFFLSMGDGIRQQVMNVNTWLRAYRLGYKECRFDKSGWIRHYPFYDTETLRLSDDTKSSFDNYIEIGRTPNFMWTYTYHYGFGAAAGGGGGCLSVHQDFFDSKNECIAEGLKFLQGKMQYGASVTNDRVNFRPEFCKKVLTVIQQELYKLENILVDKKGQISLFGS